MAETYSPYDYIEPPSQGFTPPASLPADTFGLRPRAPAPVPMPAPADEVIPSNGASSLPLERIALFADPMNKTPAVDPLLSGALKAASDVALPPGYRVEVKSGKDPRATGTPEHPAGHALDVIIYDENGRPISNAAGLGPGTKEFEVYRRLGDAFIKQTGGKGRWGGYFSRPDIMHFGNLAGMPAGANAPSSHAGAAEPPTLKAWAANVSPALQAQAESLQAEAERIRGAYHTDAGELIRQANAAPAGTRERDNAIAKLREREHEYLAKYEAISSHPPAMKPVDALQNFGSAATIIALLGGLFSRRHLTAALGAAGQAMQAINQNNYDQFQQAYKTWEQQSTTALNMVKLHNEEIRALIDDKKMAEDEKNSRLRIMFEALGMNRQADAMALGVSEKIYAEQVGLERATMSASQNKLAFQMSVAAQLEAKYIGENMDPVEARVKAQREAGILPAGGQPTSSKGREEAIQKAVAADIAKIKTDRPGITKQELDEEEYKSRLRHEQEMGRAVRQPRNAGAIAVEAFREEFRSVNGRDPNAGEIQDFMASGIEKNAAARVVGNRGSALNLAGNTLAELVPLMRTISDKINRTQYPDINKLILAAEERTGDENVVRFGEQINTVRYVYARALNPNGIARVDDLRRLDSVLNAAWSKGQINAALDQMLVTVEAEKRAIGKTRQEVKSGGVQPEAPSQPSASVQGPLPGGRGSGRTQEDPAIPATPADVDRLPSGTFYVDPRDPEHTRVK